MDYMAPESRYASMRYRRCGSSGLLLPELSLGFWHNFGLANYDRARAMARTAFDLGVTHFDLANNYGPPPGSAEECMGRLLVDDFEPYRDELVISTKAGYAMWPGPYGDHGSRKYLLASLDASLARMGLEYVDIFYSHRPDPDTPLEETMGALAQAVRSGKALYVGLSNYPPETTLDAVRVLESLGLSPLIQQTRYNMLDRGAETELLDLCANAGMGFIAFMPLAQGLLAGRYREGIPADSRAASASPFLTQEKLDAKVLAKTNALSDIAEGRGQSLAQMALAWSIRDPRVTSAVIGASRNEQIAHDVAAVWGPAFSSEELARIDSVLGS